MTLKIENFDLRIHADYCLQDFISDQPEWSAQRLRKLLNMSFRACVAVDPGGKKLVGAITAARGDAFSCYIPFFKVQTDFEGQGVGKSLVDKLLSELEGFPLVDLDLEDRLQKSSASKPSSVSL